MAQLTQNQQQLHTLLCKYPELTAKMQQVLDNAYNQLQYALYGLVTTFNLPYHTTSYLSDCITEYMEEQMNWPSPATDCNGTEDMATNLTQTFINN